MGEADRLESLDAVRGVAALVVLGYHMHTVFGGFDTFALGYLSVDLFFALSGFVMARAYEPRFASGLSPGRFFVARYRRLWPTMAIGTTIGISAVYFAGQAQPMFLATLLLVPHAGLEPFAANRPAWSIFFELLANVAHAVIMWRLPIRWLAVVALSALLLMLPSWASGNFELGNKSDDFLEGVPRVFFAYSLGIIAFRARLPIPALPSGLRLAAVSLGALSFPLYAVHYPILQIAKHWQLGPLAGSVIAIAVAAVVTFALADRVKGGPPVIVKRLDFR